MEIRGCLSTPGSAEYILPVTLSISVTPVSLYNRRRSLKMYMQAGIEWLWRCTWRPRSCKFGDALGGRDRVNSVLHLDAVNKQVWTWTEAEIEWTQKCTWRPGSSEFGDALGGHDRARLEMHWGRDRVNSEMHLEAMIDQDWRSTWRRKTVDVGLMQYAVYAVLSVYSTRWMQYSVYALLGVNSWSWHGEIERDEWTSCS